MNGSPGECFARMERERIGLDQLKRGHRSQLAAQIVREARVELHRKHRRARGEQAAGQDTKAGTNLDHPITAAQIRSGHDRIEDGGIGEEVLRERLPRSEVLGGHQAAQLARGRRLQPIPGERVGHGVGSQESARFGIASSDASARSPAA